MTSTDFRALCEELTTTLEYTWDGRRPKVIQELIERARAALAQPEPVAPTDDDVTELFYRHMGEGSQVGFENAIAEALARWGTPAIQPVPVSERLPGPKDWDVCGRCWMFDPCDRGWWAYRSALPSDDEIGRSPWTHWLPHWALPVPAIAAEALPND